MFSVAFCSSKARAYITKHQPVRTLIRFYIICSYICLILSEGLCLKVFLSVNLFVCVLSFKWKRKNKDKLGALFDGLYFDSVYLLLTAKLLVLEAY
jgi:hypothetical protein